MMRSVNLLALLVVLTAAVLTGMGKVEADAFLLLVTGLAIPARSDGYQSTGTGPAAPRQVEVVNTPDDPVITAEAAGVEPAAPPASRAARARRARDAGHAELWLLVLVVVLFVVVVGVIPTMR